MQTTKRQLKLYEFVSEQHGTQKRKSGIPYRSHLLNVAKLAQSFGIYMGFEIGLCHDLFEDTDCDECMLEDALIEIGYTYGEAGVIIHHTQNLTNEYTKKKYPNLNRKERKSRENTRLGQMDHITQSVKLCDVDDNVRGMAEYDPEFAQLYIMEKYDLLTKLGRCNAALKERVYQTIIESLNKTYGTLQEQKNRPRKKGKSVSMSKSKR